MISLMVCAALFIFVCSASAATVNFVPTADGDIVTVNVYASDVHDLYGFSVNMIYDPSIAKIVYNGTTPEDGVSAVKTGNIFQDRFAVAPINIFNNVYGSVDFVEFMVAEPSGIDIGSTPAVLARFSFKRVGAGNIPISYALSSANVTNYPLTPAGSTVLICLSDSSGQRINYSQPINTTISFNAVAITSTSLGSATANSSYSASLQAAGGVQPYVWSVVYGSLPPGTSMNNNGVLSGTPSLAGTYTFTVRVTDQATCFADKQFTIVVASASSGSPSGGGGGGGGGAETPPANSTTGEAFVSKNSGGTISLGEEASVKIPVGAFDSAQLLKIRVQKVNNPPGAPQRAAFAGQVFDFSIDGYTKYTFLKPVTIKLSYDTSVYSEKDQLGIYYYDIQSQMWVRVGGTVSGSSVTTEVDHFTSFAVLGPKKGKQSVQVPAEPVVEAPKVSGFKDLKNSWAAGSINTLVQKGLLGGYADGTFKPNNNMTRLEFTVLLAKAIGLKPDNKYQFKYKDAGAIPSWAKGYVAAVVREGWIPAIWGTKLNCATPITRAEVTYMVGRATKVKVGKDNKSIFKDAIPAWVSGYIPGVMSNGLISGYSDKTFKPQKAITRAEAATIIAKMLSLKGK